MMDLVHLTDTFYVNDIETLSELLNIEQPMWDTVLFIIPEQSYIFKIAFDSTRR